jgi:hypothetical protein
MLSEITAVRQDQPSFVQRWFQDDYFDLFLWITEKGGVGAFQLGYDRARGERVLAWSDERGLTHHRVDEQGRPLRHPATPLLVADGPCPIRTVLREFTRRSETLDETLRRFLLGRLRYARRLRHLRSRRGGYADVHRAH